jgi:hypothetical protein
MHCELRPVRVNADRHRLDAEFAEAGGPALAAEKRIGLELHANHQTAGGFEKVEEVPVLTQKNLTPAEREDEDAGLGHLVEQGLELRRGHLAKVVMIEIAGHAAFVAAVGQIELDAERDAQLQSFIGHLLQQSAHRDSPALGLRGGIGSSEICSMAGLAAWPVNTHPKTCKILAGQIQKFLAVQSVSSRKANGKVDVRFTTGWLDRR